MIFLVIALVLIFMRLAIHPIYPWRLVSVSSANLSGVLLFIVMGFELGNYSFYDPSLVILLSILFYLFLLLGEVAASSLKLKLYAWKHLGDYISYKPIFRYGLLVIFVGVAVLPVIPFVTGQQSVFQSIQSTWKSDMRAERGKTVVESRYAILSSGPLNNLISMFQRQIEGFWYLSVGLVSSLSPSLFFVLMGMITFGDFLTSGGSTSFIGKDLLMIFMVWYYMSTQKWKRFTKILLLFILIIALFVVIDALQLGRSGMEAKGSLFDRVERSLETNFAYGARGLALARHSRSANIRTSIDYLRRLILWPVPRAFWADKPITDPNWEMTEHYYSTSVANLQRITLFTPLGEALFYFGYWGIFVIPILYGFLSRLMERIYMTSPVYRGLLAHTYISAVLGMRHTFWNLYGFLIMSHFLLIVLLLVMRNLLVKRVRTSDAVGEHSCHAQDKVVKLEQMA